MSWEILLAISVVLSAIPVLLQRVLLKGEHVEPISFSILFQFGVAAIVAALTLVIHGQIERPSLAPIGWSLLLMSASYAVANIFIFNSLKVTEVSRFTVIFASKIFFAVLSLTLFFHEGLNRLQWLGAILIVVGVAIVYLQKTDSKFNRGDLYALGAALMFGVANTNDRYLVQFFQSYSYVVYGFLLPGILVALIYPRKTLYIRHYFTKDFLPKMFLLCLFNGLGSIAFFTALQLAPNSSQVFTYNTFTAILTVILSIIFLKERDYLARKLAGAAVSLIGLILVNK